MSARGRHAGWLWLPLLTLLACKNNEPVRSRYTCSCPLLTDMDDASEQRVRVCSTTETVEATAAGCAQAAAPGTIQSCTCQPLSEPCATPNECTPLER